MYADFKATPDPDPTRLTPYSMYLMKYGSPATTGLDEKILDHKKP